ncbi:MAG: CarD family transcriptional regulator [Hyphomicrobiales bacterium]
MATAKKKARATVKKKPVAKKPAAKPAHKPAAKTVKAAKPAHKPAAKPVAAQHKPAAAAAKPVHKPAHPPVKPAAHAPVKPAAAPAPAPAAAKVVAPQAPRPAQPPVAAKPAAPAAAPAPQAPKKLSFKVNELIVYPAHGVGKIVQIEEQEIAGAKLELYIVDFEKEKLRLKVPTSRAEQKGMRKLADKYLIEQAMKVLKGRARIKRTMWSRRAQEYEAKINSGDLIAVAEVVRDLYRSERQPEQSYSERQLYEQALERMAREYAAVRRIDDDAASKELEEFLSKNAKRASEKAEAEVPAEQAA